MAPFSLLIKPAGPDCNMACAYCFYAQTEALFAPGEHRMSDLVLETLVQDYLSVNMPTHHFIWQGGEPTLMGLPFFERAVALQKQYGHKDRVVSNALQTNGLRLDKAWCEFLREHRILVGISLDGPESLHNHYRVDDRGQGTFARVMQSISLCREQGVEFNTLTLLNSENVTQPDRVFDFLVQEDFRFVQFIPCTDRHPRTGDPMPYAVTGPQYGAFMCRIFDRWVAHGVDRLSVRLFDSLVSYILEGHHTCCTFNKDCDNYVVVEHQGDVFCCDFYVTPETRLGNIMDTPVATLARGEAKRSFARAKRKIPASCFVCRHHALCRGGCPSDRPEGDGDTKNCMCEGYQLFFDHALPRLKEIVASFVSQKNHWT
ncbi:MAG: anaerobic sulfatase maturase [Phycisphaerae bacterium]|nr:anaerobic sulfatase maturase [Phycisphaerae bacterium]